MLSHIGKCDLLICVNVCFVYLYCLGCVFAVVTPPCPGRTPVCRCCRTSDTLCAYLLIVTSYHAYNISRISYQQYNPHNPHNQHNHSVHTYISVVYTFVCVFVVFIYVAGSFCLLLWHLLTLGRTPVCRCCHTSDTLCAYMLIVLSVYLILQAIMSEYSHCAVHAPQADDSPTNKRLYLLGNPTDGSIVLLVNSRSQLVPSVPIIAPRKWCRDGWSNTP